MICLDKTLEAQFDCAVKEHCDAQKNLGIPVTVCLLIGSRLAESVFHAFHTSKCPLPESADKETVSIEAKSAMIGKSKKVVEDVIDSEWIVNHCAQVIRTLPGGVDIIGLMLLADKKTLTEGTHRPILLRALKMLSSVSCQISWMKRRRAESKACLMTLEIPIGQPSAVIVDVLAKNWGDISSSRVAFQCLHWTGLQSTIRVDLPLAVPSSVGMGNFLRLFTASLSEWIDRLIESKCFLINGRLPPGDTSLSLESVLSLAFGNNDAKSKKKLTKQQQKQQQPKTLKKTEKRIVFDLMSDLSSDQESSTQSRYCGDVLLKMTLRCHAAVPCQASIDDAFLAVIQDIVRSLYSRAEMHFESMTVVEDENRDAVAVHELPRRALGGAPNQLSVQFSDYLFEDDSVQDACQSFRDLLGLNLLPENVDVSLERIVAEEDLEMMDISLPTPPVDSPRSQQKMHSLERDERNLTVIYVVLAALVALLAVIVIILLQSGGG